MKGIRKIIANLALLVAAVSLVVTIVGFFSHSFHGKAYSLLAFCICLVALIVYFVACGFRSSEEYAEYIEQREKNTKNVIVANFRNK